MVINNHILERIPNTKKFTDNEITIESDQPKEVTAIIIPDHLYGHYKTKEIGQSNSKESSS